MVPIDLLDTLHHTWCSICHEYDVTAELPDMQTLFEEVDLALPSQASQTVLANMLTEVITRFGRFSPWYKKPAAAFGLALVQDPATSHIRWCLSPQAVTRWQPLLEPLTIAVERNISLILSVTFIDDLERRNRPDDSCVTAICACSPPRVILVNRSVFVGANITCDACQNQFQPVEDAPDTGDWLSF